MNKLFCKLGFHDWTHEQTQMICFRKVYSDDKRHEGMPVFQFKKERYKIRIKQCGSCKKMKVEIHE